MVIFPTLFLVAVPCSFHFQPQVACGCAVSHLGILPTEGLCICCSFSFSMVCTLISFKFLLQCLLRYTFTGYLKQYLTVLLPCFIFFKVLLLLNIIFYMYLFIVCPLECKFPENKDFVCFVHYMLSVWNRSWDIVGAQ